MAGRTLAAIWLASDRICGAVDIVLGHHGVHTKTALARRKAVVAPLHGEYGFQFSTGPKIIEHVSGRVPGESQKWRAQPHAEDTAKESGQGFFREVEGKAPRALVNSLEAAIDRVLLAGERSNERVAQMVPAADIVEAEPVDVHSVVHVGHGVRGQAAFSQVLEQGHRHYPKVVNSTILAAVRKGLAPRQRAAVARLHPVIMQRQLVDVTRALRRRVRKAASRTSVRSGIEQGASGELMLRRICLLGRTG